MMTQEEKARLERERWVQDAVLLERAERVLERRYPEGYLPVQECRETLSSSARAFREEAEHG